MGASATAVRATAKHRTRAPRLTEACHDHLDAEDVRLLEQLLSQKHDFIDHPRLDEEAAEAELFAEGWDQAILMTGASTPTVPARFEKLTVEDEQTAFLRYNLARRRLAELLARHEGSKPVSLNVGRSLVHWHRRILAIRAFIVNANFPLVLAMAKHSRFAMADMNEMISEGNMALLRSVNKYDLTKGFRFSSYACRSILKAFSRVALRVGRYRHRFPTEYDESLERSDHQERRRQEQQEHLLDILQTVMDKNSAHLSDVERLVISERFAVQPDHPDSAEPKTLGEVGEMVGLTKERVRQIQNRALEKLRIAMANRFAAA